MIRNFLRRLFHLPALTAKRHTHIAALMPEDERQAAFLQAPGHVLWAAVLADLDDFTLLKSDSAVDENLSEAAVRFRLGGQDALLEFKERLQVREAEARLTQSQQEALNDTKIG